jgi:acylphosphatase
MFSVRLADRSRDHLEPVSDSKHSLPSTDCALKRPNKTVALSPLLWLDCPSKNQVFAEKIAAMKRQQVHVFYSGRVQGVGFRYTVKVTATGFDVTGTVKNLDDGRVELFAEGEKNELDAFLDAIRESEVGRFVKNEQASWGEAKNEFRGFEIIR